VSKHSVAYANQTVTKNTRVEGIPSVVVERFMKYADRVRYFGLSPKVWTTWDGAWTRKYIDEMPEKGG